jgi:ABC-type nitrate/sulfonate/bicarbonate transport system ATPase subunit
LNLYIFDEMLKVIVLLNNQIHLFDSNCIMIGRSGTGKSTLLKVVAYLNKLTICSDAYDISETIVRCLKG